MSDAPICTINFTDGPSIAIARDEQGRLFAAMDLATARNAMADNLEALNAIFVAVRDALASGAKSGVSPALGIEAEARRRVQQRMDRRINIGPDIANRGVSDAD